VKKYGLGILLLVLGLLAIPQAKAQSDYNTTGSLTTTCANTNTSCAGTAGSSLSINTSNYGTVTVTMHGTYSTATVNFEFSDDGGTSFYPTACVETATPTNIESSKSGLSTGYIAWQCAVVGATSFRVRVSAITSGTILVGLTASKGSPVV